MTKDRTASRGDSSLLFTRLSRLPFPVLLFDRHGRRLFGNPVASRNGYSLRRLPKEVLPSLDKSLNGAILMLQQGRRTTPTLCLPLRNGFVCLFTASAVSAAALVTAEHLENALPLLRAVWERVSDEEALPPTPWESCRMVAEGLLSPEETRGLSCERYVGLADLSFRLLFGEAILSPLEEACFLTDPLAAFGALGEAMRLLTEAATEGRSLDVTLTREGESLFLNAAGEALTLGRCRVPALAEAAAPFVYREEDAVFAFSLTSAAEITFF
jgi:hypothetical protein